MLARAFDGNREWTLLDANKTPGKTPFPIVLFAICYFAIWYLPSVIDKTMKTKVLSRLDRESVAILTFERPTKLIALNYELVDSIVHALERMEEEKHIRAVVLTGSGRAFSAGADIHEFSKDVGLGPQAAYRRFVRRGQNMTRRIENFSKPIIAAVNGLDYGGGCEISL